MISYSKHTYRQDDTIITRADHISFNRIKTYLIVFSSFLLFLSYSVCSFAQYTYTLDKTTRFDKLGINEGLSTDLSSCIYQDKYGFIWIGTKRGLNLYDGYQVKSFMSSPNDSTSISHDLIYSMCEEEDGTMWFTTDKGTY